MRTRPIKRVEVASRVALVLVLALIVIVGLLDKTDSPGGFQWGRPKPGNIGRFQNLWGELPENQSAAVLDAGTVTSTTYDDAFTATYLVDGQPAFSVAYVLNWLAYPNNLRYRGLASSSLPTTRCDQSSRRPISNEKPPIIRAPCVMLRSAGSAPKGR